MTTMISYAQNFEDVMLWRCFKNIENGLYIDVGANDPVLDSVSLVFYKRGWRGINIEPSADYYKKLIEARPDEKIIQAALGVQPGEVTFYDIPSTGLSTTDLNIAKEHENKGLDFVETKIRQLTLDQILSDVNQDVYWLKIDVEGAEKAVLAGWRDSPARPWVLVIESTLPRSEQESYESWENHVLDKGYEFVYFDGLNRFYLSKEHLELKKHFRAPPNVFDEFVTKKVVDLAEEVEYEKSIVAQTNEQLNDAKQAFFNTQNRLKEVEEQLSRSQRALEETQGAVKQYENKLQEVNENFKEVKDRLVAERDSLLKDREALQKEKDKLSDKDKQLKNLRKRLRETAELLTRTQSWGDSLQNRINHLEHEINLGHAHSLQLQSQVNAILSSFYWRLTFPLRWLKGGYNGLFASRETFKKNVKSLLHRSAGRIQRYPALRIPLVKTLRFVGLYDKAKALQNKVAQNNGGLQQVNSTNITDGMTPYAKRIFSVITQEKSSYLKKGGM